MNFKKKTIEVYDPFDLAKNRDYSGFLIYLVKTVNQDDLYYKELIRLAYYSIRKGLTRKQEKRADWLLAYFLLVEMDKEND